MKPLFITVALAAGCATAPLPAAVLRVSSAPPAQLYLDERFAGTTGRSVAIRPGYHRIELHAEGHFHAYREVTLGPGERRTLDVTLRPDLDRSEPETPR